MLRLPPRRCGSYLLNQRLIADWWQPRYREYLHESAKATLRAALQSDANISPPTASSIDDEQGYEGHKGDMTAATTTTSSPLNGLSLYEANALVATFVSHHNTADLSATLQYIRERLEQELSTYHYHALLRNFNHHRDVENASQLLDVMVEGGSMTLETYARVADAIHVLSPPDALDRLLRIVGLAQEAFGSQVMLLEEGGEAATVAAYSSSDVGRKARQLNALATSLAEMKPAGDEGNVTPCNAPVLSSLLQFFAFSTCSSATITGSILVTVWMRALGVELSDWDVFAVLSSVLTHADDFPRACAIFASFDGFERGQVSVQGVLDRLVLLGEVEATVLEEKCSPTTTGASAPEGVDLRVANTNIRSSNGASATPLTALVRAMRTSLAATGKANIFTTAFRTPFANAQTHDLQELVQCTLRDCAVKGVGAERYNAGHVFHALSLIHGVTRDPIAAMQTLSKAIEIQEELLTKTAEKGNTAAPPAEAFAVPVQHLLDMGSIFSRLSGTALQSMRRPFRGAVRRHVQAITETTTPPSPSTSGMETAEEDYFADYLSVATGPLTSCSPPVPTTKDLVRVGHYETQFLRTTAEARAVLRRAIDSGNASFAHGRLSGDTQLLFMQLAEFCGRHPPRNPKLTAAGLEERSKWARYLDARDTSLTLFGSARQSRDSMKHLFYHDNEPPALRTDVVIAKDFADVHRIFFEPLPPTTSQAELQRALLRTRTTMPHVGAVDGAVPPYLWDPTIYNPYPSANLANNSAAVDCGVFSPAELETEDDAAGLLAGEEMEDVSEFFVELWQALLDRTTVVGSNEVWYLQNTSMYLLLIRCLLHRLDWEAAVHLTRKMSQHSAYTYMMDQELTTIFSEIGDPAGCLAFKVATKLFDGRITKDGQTKREQFHQERFS